MKDELVRQVTGKKESGLFKYWAPEKKGDFCLKVYLNIPVQAEVFIRQWGKEHRNQREGAHNLSTCRPAQSILIMTSELIRQWSGVHHPSFRHLGFMSS